MLISDYSEREARRKRKREAAIRFLALETWTIQRVLQSVLRCSRSASYKLISQLEKEGIIRSHAIEDLRLTALGITPHGVAIASSEYDLPISLATFQPSKIRPVSVAHRIDLQRARVAAEGSGWTDWTLAKSLPKTWTKLPDAVAQSASGQIVAVELERVVKSRRRYEAILSQHLQAITQGRYDIVHYVSPSRPVASAIDRMFRSVSRVPVGGQRVTLSAKHRARLPVFELEQWPPLA